MSGIILPVLKKMIAFGVSLGNLSNMNKQLNMESQSTLVVLFFLCHLGNCLPQTTRYFGAFIKYRVDEQILSTNLKNIIFHNLGYYRLLREMPVSFHSLALSLFMPNMN